MRPLYKSSPPIVSNRRKDSSVRVPPWPIGTGRQNDDEVVTGNLVGKLHELGLTKQEAEIYKYLLKENMATAKTISEFLRIPVQAVYRSCHNLNRLGFLGEQKLRPVEFIVVPKKLSVPSYVKSREKKFESITREILLQQSQRKEKVNPTKVTMVFGEKEMFESSIKAFTRAKGEILVVSIGQELPEELLLAQRNAVFRGVQSRMIAHKHDKTNTHILESFKKNGIEVRHFPDRGFHLVIVDGRYCLVAANNPKNTKERVGIEFYSEALSGAMRDYFYIVWGKSKPI